MFDSLTFCSSSKLFLGNNIFYLFLKNNNSLEKIVCFYYSNPRSISVSSIYIYIYIYIYWQNKKQEIFHDN